MNSPLTSKQIESAIKNLAIKKYPGQMVSMVNSAKHLKELMPILLRLFQKLEEGGIFLYSFYEASITLIYPSTLERKHESLAHIQRIPVSAS